MNEILLMALINFCQNYKGKEQSCIVMMSDCMKKEKVIGTSEFLTCVKKIK